MEGTKINKSKIAGIALLLILATNIGIMTLVRPCEAAYSPALIAELGEASTVLIYSQIAANVKVPIPDANWNPTNNYYPLVAIAVGAWSSGFFVNSNGYIVTAGHSLFCFTHTDFTQDLYTKQLVVIVSFLTILAAYELAEYHFTLEEQTLLQTYMQTYATLQDSIRLVYAVLGEVKATLTEVQTKGWTARVVAVSPYIERDTAILKVELSNCPILKVGDSDKVMTGDNVYMFGFPSVVTFHSELGPETTLAPSMTNGIISAKRLTNFQTPCFQTSALITHGNSGGPGLNDDGEAVGICSRGSITETGQEVAGFDFLIQSKVVQSFLTENSVSNEKGPVDDAFLRGLNYFYAKHYSAAKAEFDTASGLFAYHWRAKDLILECNAAIAREEDVSLSSFTIETWMIIGVFIVVAVAVAIIAISLVLRRKSKTALVT